jgi:hypothetical protein
LYHGDKLPVSKPGFWNAGAAWLLEQEVIDDEEDVEDVVVELLVEVVVELLVEVVVELLEEVVVELLEEVVVELLEEVLEEVLLLNKDVVGNDVVL